MQKDSCHQEGGSSELIQSKGRILERKLPAKERENSSSSQPAGKPCSRQFVIRFRTHFQLTLGSGDRYSETTPVGPGAEGGFKWHFSKDQQAPPPGAGATMTEVASRVTGQPLEVQTNLDPTLGPNPHHRVTLG